jgi:hypothetical protein
MDSQDLYDKYIDLIDNSEEINKSIEENKET